MSLEGFHTDFRSTSSLGKFKPIGFIGIEDHCSH
jgi:hypothetical protein